MSRKPQKPRTNIYMYSNFRTFLKDVVAEFKETREGFTMRTFAEQAGVGSPSFLKMIIDGERSLTTSSLEKFCEVFHIKGRERDYFETLVAFNQSTDPDEKHKLMKTLDDIRPRVTFSELKKQQRRYLKNDYYTAIREMVLLKNFKEDSKWIAAKCQPRIKPAEAREAIKTLLDMGLLKRDEQGKLIQTDPIVDTGHQAEAIEAFSFHEAVLNKARRYLALLQQDQRNFTALTIPIPLKLESKILEKIRELEDEILEMVNEEGLEYDEVYQMNIQLFPVTNSNQKDSSKD